MKLFFDTETTGKSDFRASYTSKTQPHICQLAALLTNDEGEEISSIDVFIKPDGWTIPPDVSEIHGITTELADRYGTPLIIALEVFDCLCKAADEIIAHNDDFDHLVTRAAFHRIQKEPNFITMRRYCTMKSSTNICKIPGSYGRYKWPTLAEAHRIIVGTEIEKAHNAMADVRSCKNIYFKIHEAKPPQSGE